SFRRTDRVLGRAERLVDHLGGQILAAAAFHALRGFELDPGFVGELNKRLAGLRLVGKLSRLGLQPGCQLLVTPTRFDAILDLVERAIAGRRYAQHVDPDVAAARQLHRIALHADVGSEGTLEHARALRQTGHRLTIGTAAGAVDRRDLARVQPELLRDL